MKLVILWYLLVMMLTLQGLVVTLRQKYEEMVAVATSDEPSSGYTHVHVERSHHGNVSGEKNSLIEDSVSTEKGCLQRGHTGLPSCSLPPLLLPGGPPPLPLGTSELRYRVDTW